MNKQAVTSLIEVVTVLFAAFGAFLTTVAPPPGTNYELSAVGLASLIALVLLAFIKLLFKYLEYEKNKDLKPYLWVIALSGIAFIGLSLNYFSHITSDSFQFPEYQEGAQIYLAGKEYTADATKIITGNESLEGSHVQLVMTFGGIERINDIWSRSSITDNRNALTWKYVFMVIFLCFSLGIAIEGLAVKIDD